MENNAKSPLSNKLKKILVKTPEYEGYFFDDLEKVLPAETYKKFSDWMGGQTCGVIDGKMVVYKWDLDKFLSGGYKNSADWD